MNRVVLVIAAAVTVTLIVFAGGYGYHRDELYFLAAGHRLAPAYADQGPLTPMIARAMSSIAPGSLTILRIPSALAAGAIVLLTGMTARELGGSRRAEWIAAACAAVSSVVLFTGHLLSTSTFDLLVWTAVIWLVIRAVRTGAERLWIVAGVVLGIGLLNKPLPAFLAVGLIAGVVIAGPRRLFRSPMVWVGGAVALALWSPWIVWQAQHSWPQIDVSRSIASGNSTSSQPWWAILPFQFLLVSPLLAPILIAGVVRLFRAPELRDVRFTAWASAVLAVIFMASGGKPYYLAGLLPVVLGAGAIWVDDRLASGLTRPRVVIVALVVSAAVNAVISLPILPADDTGIVVAMNGDVGETIGWPAFTRTIAKAAERASASPVILTGNYGEAGAVDRFGPALGLPPAYSGHNAFAEWGPPPGSAGPVVAVGVNPRDRERDLRKCRQVGKIDNGDGVDNDEQDTPLYLCSGPRAPWAEIWPDLRHLG
jgi:4-amino-4-deoxy-L-arabinose transferase-like glycosyltransferase